MRDLEGKVAVVTGAASRIGRALAEPCGKTGMKVVLADIEQVPLTPIIRRSTMAKPQPRPFTPSEEKFGNIAVQFMSKANTWVYRATGGKLGAKFTHGAPVFLLVTKGRKTGERRTAPLIYIADGDDWLVVASKGGMSKHPQWYLNLEATPECEIEIGKERIPVTATRVDDEEKKKRLWSKVCEVYPDYADYQARTERNIPVIRLSRRPAAS